MITFLTLSLLSGALELGVLFLSCASGRPIWCLLVLPLMYQLGNLMFTPSFFTPRRAAAAGGAGLALLPLSLRLHIPALFAVTVLLASLCIQAARAARKASCPTWLKRSFRIGGFLLSPLMAITPGPVTAACLLVSAIALLLVPDSGKKTAPPPQLTPVMVFHQMHYFVYAYIMPAWLLSKSGSIVMSAGMFALSWLVYLLPQVIAERATGVDHRAMFFVCHGFLALVMAALCAASALSGSTVAICILWLLTGLGGGSVFCISHLTPACQAADMTFSENVGHVLGVLAAMLIAAWFPTTILPALTGVSCMFVCLALVFAAHMIVKEVGPYAAGR